MKRIYIVLALALLVSSCSVDSSDKKTASSEISPAIVDKDGSLEMELNKVTVEMTASGFAPNPANIKAGDTVVFLNKDTVDHWPASAVHPTHELLPGFDALKPVKPGESYEFTFSEKGDWKYHDHLDPSTRGVVAAS